MAKTIAELHKEAQALGRRIKQAEQRDREKIARQAAASSAPTGNTGKSQGWPAGPTASGLFAQQDQDEAPGLKLPTVDSFMPDNMKAGMKQLQAMAYRNGTPASVKLATTQLDYDRVTKELEQAREDQRQADEDMGWTMFRSGTTFDPALATANRASESAGLRVGELETRQEQLARELYEYRNQRDAARLSSDTGAAGSGYTALLDAADAERALRTITEAGRSGSLSGVDADVKALTERYGVTAEQLRDYANYMYNQSLRGQRGTAAPKAVNGGYQAVLDLLDDLQTRRAGAKDALTGAGYDADALLDWQDRQRRAAQAEQRRQETADYVSRGWGEAALGSAGTVLASPLQGLEYLGQLTGNIGHNDPADPATYRPLDPSRMALTDYVDTVRGTVAENIRGEDSSVVRNALAFLYETGMSIADSATQVALLGPASMAAMGGSAAAQRTREVLDNGGTNRQALMAGAASGILEALFEKVSIDNLLKEKSVTGWKSWIRETAKQAGVEASEEILTEVANMMADAAIMGEDSDFSRSVAQYQAKGLSEDDAKRQTLWDAVGQVGMAGLGGAVSGGIMGGFNNARMGVRNSQILSDAGKGILPDVDTWAELELTEAGRDIKNQVRERYEQFVRDQQGTQEGQEGPSTPEAVPAQEQEETAPLPSQAGSQATDHIGEANNMIPGKNETAPESGAVNENGLTALTERERVNFSGGMRNRIVSTFQDAVSFVRNALTNRQSNERAYLGKVPNKVAQKVLDETGVDIRGYNAIMRGDDVRHIVKNHGDQAAEGSRGQVAVTEEDIARIPEVLSSPDTIVPSPKTDERGRRALIFQKQIGNDYITVQAVSDGTHSIQTDSLYIRKKNSQGTESYDVGSATDPAHNAQSVPPQSSSVDSVPQPAGNVNTGRPAPGVRDLRGQDGGLRLRSILGDEDVEFLDRLGKAAGVAINVVDADGQANGWYQDGQIYITANAAREGENSLVRQVALHEVTHYMKDAAPEEYRRYTEQIAELQGEDLDGAVARVRDEYEAGGVTLNDEEAMDELAAHYTENLLEDRDLFRRLALEDRTLAQRVLDALRRFIERIKGVFTGRQSGQMEQIAQAWADALDQAGANARQGGVEYSEGRRYSIGYDRDNRPFVTVDEDILDGVPRSEWVRTVKNNLREKFPDGVTVGNQEIKINKQSRGEMTFSRYMQRLFDREPQMYADKLRATNNADEVLQASTDWVNEALLHPRRDDIIDFARGQVQMRVGGRDYTAQVIVGNRGDSGLLLYDIINLAPTEIRERTKKPGAAYTANAQNEPRSRGPAPDDEPGTGYTAESRNGTGDRQPMPMFESSVAQSGKEVNPRRELTFQEEVQRQLTGEDPRDAENRRAYSLQSTEGLGKELHELRRQNQRLEEKNKRLQAQFRRTDGNHVDPAAVKSVARKLLRDFNSKADLDETAAAMESIYDHMGETGLGHRDQVMRNAARNLAQDIVDNASVTFDEMWQTYKPLRKFLRETKIKVTPDVMGGLDVVGGLDTYRKAFRNLLNLSTKEGRSIDDVYGELSYDYPELFNTDVHSNEEEQLAHLGEVLDAMRPVAGNPYTGDEGVVDYLAGEILERYYDMPGEAPTFADRAAYRQEAAVERERQAGLERMQRTLARLEARTKDQIERIKEQNRQANARMRERMTTTQVKDTIYRHVNTLGQRLRYPSDKARIPEALRWPAIDLLDSLDLQGRFGYVADEKGKIELPVGTDENGEVVKGRFRRVKVIDKNGNRVPPLNEDGSPYTGEVRQSSRTQAALELKAALEKLVNNEEYELVIDPDLADKLNEIAGMKNKTVAAMSADEARTVWETVRAVEHAISNADKVLGQSKYKKLSDMAEAIRSENGDRKDRRNLAKGILDDADKLLNLDMLTAETYFHRLGKAGDDLYRQMREAQDKQIAITGEGVDFFQSALEESGLTVKDILRAERENHSFTVGGQKVTISTAQLMDLYALFKREQAMDHITIGGLYFEGGRDGLYQTGQSKPVHVTVEDLGEMLNTLTPAQRGLVDRLQNYMSTTLAGYGNEATEAVYGYWKFKERHYWPIKVHNTQLKTDAAQDVKAKTIPSFGMTRALTPNANNAVTVRSFLDSYTEHLNQMATYAGWLEASENITRLHNFKFTVEGKRTGETVKTLFKKVYGEGGDAYLDNLMQDIAQGTRTGDPAGLTSKLVRNFKVNAVAGNFRVILQQPTAILRAAEVINPVYMATPGNPLEAFEEAKKWAKIAQWKDWGYFEMGTGRSLRELMVGPEGAMDKFRNLAGTGAGFADNVGWGILWNAVKAETRARHKELRAGSDAFFRQCAERFGEIIDRTQVVDSVLHRTQIMRSGDGLTQMATSFMSEPSKIYNMVARDVYDITHAEKGSPERKRAIRHVARTGIALTASYVVNAAAQAVMDAIRNDDRDKEYSEKFLEAYTGLDGTEETAKDVVLHLLGGNLGQNYLVFGYLPYVKDIQSIIQGYDVTRADMDGVSKTVAAAQTLEKALAGTGKKTVLNAGLETAMKGLGLLGLPVDRLKRDLVGLGNTLLLGFGKNEAVYEMDKLMLDVGNSNNASVFYDTLYRAMDGDWMEYQHIYGDMLKNGFTPGNINTAMEKRMAEEAGIAKDRMLPVKWAPPGEDEEFDAMMQADGSWLDQVDEDVLEAARQVSAAETEEVEKVEEEWHEKERQTDWDLVRTVADQPFNEDVKELTMENAMGKTAYAKYMAARDAGVSTYDYVNFLEDAKAANIARGKDGSSPSQDDVEKALNGSRLTAAQKRAIWEAQGWKKESPWG